MAKTYKNQAVSYIRTSSGSNLGDGKDSEPRQRQKIAAYAKANGIELVGEFRDPAVKGSEGLEGRPGFAQLLTRIEGNGVRTVICEDASRLARDLLTQELGIILLQKLGVTLITATGESLTQTNDPMKKAMRQIAGAFSELEKARLVAKLKHARDAKREKNGKCEGRKAISQTAPVACARALQLKAILADRKSVV